MRIFLIVLTLMLGLSGPATAQSSEIEATIGSQMEAFKADDFGQAFGFASPTIQGIFGTPQNFGMMVRQGYPMVHRPAEIRYLELREINGALWQKVQITDAAGHVHLLDYEMILLENTWKINAVTLLKQPGASV